MNASWGAENERVNGEGGRDVEGGAGGASEQVAAIESRPLGRTSLRTGAKTAPDASNDGRANSAGTEVMRVAGALAIVIGLLLGLRFLLRRVGTGSSRSIGGNGALEIVASYPVARGQRLLLVRLANRIVLVHQSGGSMTSMTALSEVAEPAEVEEVLSHVGGSSGTGPGHAVASLLGGLFANHRVKAWDGNAGAAWPPVEVVDLTQDGGRRSGAIGKSGRAR
jgi:flagellar biogenesis protein FliO